MNRTAAATANGPAAPAVRPDENYSVLERLVIKGDLEALTADQRLDWYRIRCEAAGLDPRSQPFEYIRMPKGGLKLYATKAATDQLIANRKLSVEILERRYDAQLYIYEVRARVRFPDGQSVEDIGTISLDGLGGENLCNAIMKCVTKAKRRTVLSACGLGMLDETEVESIPDARVVRPAQSSLPSPRPMPGAALASHPEPVEATPEPAAEPETQPAPDGFWTWLQRRVDEVNNDWASFCVKEKKPHETLVKHVNEALNGVITMWLEKELIRPEQINGSKKGTRSNSKMRYVVDTMLADDERATEDDFDLYFENKWSREVEKLGVNMDAEPEEAAHE